MGLNEIGRSTKGDIRHASPSDSSGIQMEEEYEDYRGFHVVNTI